MEEDGSYSEDYLGNSTNVFFDKGWPMRAVVGVTCVLSITGSLLIIFSYFCFVGLRTRARLILVHLSVMDAGVALANLIGDAVNFDQYYTDGSKPISTDVPTHIQNLCVSQAFIAEYFTLGSVLWTTNLAIYMYFLVLHHDTKLFLYFCYVFTYGVSLLISLWLVFTGRLGFAPYDSSGWCSIIAKKPATGDTDYFGAAIGYDLWIYLAIVITLVVYLSVHFYLSDEYQKSLQLDQTSINAMKNVEYKFIMIPLVFILLRVWTCIIGILLIYVGLEEDDFPSWLATTLLYLSGIGDSGQGFANAVLFIAFTKNVRKKFYDCFCFRRKHQVGGLLYCNTKSLYHSFSSDTKESHSAIPVPIPAAHNGGMEHNAYSASEHFTPFSSNDSK